MASKLDFVKLLVLNPSKKIQEKKNGAIYSYKILWWLEGVLFSYNFQIYDGDYKSWFNLLIYG